MSTQPEALRLADVLDRYYEDRGPSDEKKAAIELRRLHAANIDCIDHFNALMAERNELLAALKLAAEINPFGSVENAAARDAARAAIAKAKT